MQTEAEQQKSDGHSRRNGANKRHSKKRTRLRGPVLQTSQWSDDNGHAPDTPAWWALPLPLCNSCRRVAHIFFSVVRRQQLVPCRQKKSVSGPHSQLSLSLKRSREQHRLPCTVHANGWAQALSGPHSPQQEFLVQLAKLLVELLSFTRSLHTRNSGTTQRNAGRGLSVCAVGSTPTEDPRPAILSHEQEILVQDFISLFKC